MQVQLVDLVKDFGQTVAVDHVNLTIKDGALTGLLGPSGCGKSTTLYMISGLEQPTSGKILFDGEDVTEVPAEERGIEMCIRDRINSISGESGKTESDPLRSYFSLSSQCFKK